MKLEPINVHAVMTTCLYRAGETNSIPENAIQVDGLVRKFAFHPERTMEEKPTIDALLMELPDQFQKSQGGGWSFLNACMDRNGRQWGEHRDIEELVCLGIAVKSASWLMKDMADILPGGMPYFVVDPTPTPAQHGGK